MVAEILLLVSGFNLFIYGIYHLIRRNREKYDYKKYICWSGLFNLFFDFDIPAT